MHRSLVRSRIVHSGSTPPARIALSYRLRNRPGHRLPILFRFTVRFSQRSRWSGSAADGLRHAGDQWLHKRSPLWIGLGLHGRLAAAERKDVEPGNHDDHGQCQPRPTLMPPRASSACGFGRRERPPRRSQHARSRRRHVAGGPCFGVGHSQSGRPSRVSGRPLLAMKETSSLKMVMRLMPIAVTLSTTSPYAWWVPSSLRT